MLKQFVKWTSLSSSPCFLPHFSTDSNSTFNKTLNISSFIKGSKLDKRWNLDSKCSARRRAVYEDEEEDEEYGYNAEIAMLETYTQSARNEALLVKAMVDEEEVEVLIFKVKNFIQIMTLVSVLGFSSCLSYGTSPDPSRSVLPARAEIKFIDRVKGPFEPSNIEYIEKGLTWEIFKSRLQSN
ncbi:uncharacterized protein [Coffea arabica]|uniref:Uncharacterized protein isoform X1 n=1 Tax=Coffea arabica TaxID=13443 RepID=A0A6P6V193_COFAR|nr:uncharacterized protein LOC113716370 isoform X1 [Coffea arabica]